MAELSVTLRSNRKPRAPAALSARIGEATNAQRITVNLSEEIGDQLRRVASRYHVSESSVVEIALRHLLRSIGISALESFLHENGGCLRRRRSES